MSSGEPFKSSNVHEAEKLDTESSASNEELVIPVMEEQVKVGRTVVETGRVKLIKRVEEHQEKVTSPLTQEEVTVERKPMNQYLEEIPVTRQEGDTLIYPVLKEVLVIEKKLLLVEEIHVTRHQRTTIANEEVTLRTESVSVERESLNEERPG